ncbi:hypothetical protein C8E05_7216 [Rhodococcus wratislaviensis]|nr:hypothetical protein C8E05_7216 [Rhodococcus wratislaviensis]
MERGSPGRTRRGRRDRLRLGGADSGQIDTESSALVEFALRWLPFGGPRADDILVTFGISTLTFARRLQEVLASDHPPRLSLAERNGLREMAAALGRPSERP